MRNKFQIIFFLLFCASDLLAQNLIPNPSFEDTLLRITPLYAPTNWYAPTIGSPDLFTPYNKTFSRTPENFIGYQYPFSGENYMGILMYSLSLNNDSKRFREYIQNELIDSLIQDSTYCLQFYISLADSSQYASKGVLGVYFSKTAISSNDFYYLPYTPQIIVSSDSFITEKENWLQFEFDYQAMGGEKYITIGNFSDSNIVDTLFVNGSKSLEFKNTYYYIDDVYLGNCDSLPMDTPIGLRENSLEKRISVYPNPFENRVVVRYNGNQNLNFILYNLLGQSVETASYLAVTTTDYQLSLGHLPKGLYFLEIVAGENRISRKIIKQ